MTPKGSSFDHSLHSLLALSRSAEANSGKKIIFLKLTEKLATIRIKKEKIFNFFCVSYNYYVFESVN